MNLEFILYEINKESRLWDLLKKSNELNEFIIVGEEKENRL